MGTTGHEKLVLNIVRSLLSSKSSREFADTLASQLTKLFSFDTAGLYLYTPASESMTPITSSLRDPTHIGYRITQLPPLGTIKLAAAQSGTTMLCEDLLTSKWSEKDILREYSSACSVGGGPLNIQSLIGDRTSSRAIAVMFIARLSRDVFTEEDRLQLAQLAQDIAPVLHMVLASEERHVIRAISTRMVLGTITIEGVIPAIRDILKQVIPHDQTCLVKFTTTGREDPGFIFCTRMVDLLIWSRLRKIPVERMAPTEMLRTGRPGPYRRTPP